MKRAPETRTAAQILDELWKAFHRAESSLSELNTARSGRHLTEVVNLAQAGYGIRSSLARLRRGVAGFEEWYAAKQAEWSADPLIQWFDRIRDDVTHHAREPEAGTRLQIRNFSTRSLGVTRPPGATMYTMDMQGRGKWHVPHADGTVTEVPAADPPGSSIEVQITLQPWPEFHLGKQLRAPTAAKVSELYVAYLQALLSDCDAKFRGKGAR